MNNFEKNNINIENPGGPKVLTEQMQQKIEALLKLLQEVDSLEFIAT